MTKPSYYKSLREQIANKCIHFNGTLNKVCKAGVNYNTFRQQWDSTCCGFPCLKDSKTPLSCGQREWPSEEYIQARLDEIEEATLRHMKAGSLVAEFREKNKGKDAQESFPCPACEKGTLNLSISAYNGHVWGKCTTDNCLAWME